MRKTVAEFPIDATPIIIATKGLPCTGKSAISELLSAWGRCPLVSMDDLLETLSMEKGYSAKSPPSPEEADRLHRLACDALLKVARRKLNFNPCSVVVKTRLCSSFEVDVLLRLALAPLPLRLIIVECRVKNEHRYRTWLEHSVELYGPKEWYNHTTWKDIENAHDEIDDQGWDDHVRGLIDKFPYEEGDSLLVLKMVVDPFDDLNIDQSFTTTSYTLLNAISYLMQTSDIIELMFDEEKDLSEDKELSDEEVGDLLFIKNFYVIVEYDKLQRYLFKLELKASRNNERSKSICAAEGSDCMFRFVVPEDQPNDENIYCGVCEKLVHGDQSAYTCYFCVLTMHESCAKVLNMEFLQLVPYRPNRQPWLDYPKKLKEMKGFSEECESCIFHTHLKCKMLPTIINHEAHKHLLSIRILESMGVCKACGGLHEATWYVCYICKFYFELECIFLPAQVIHKHGGYEHVMKLMYSYKAGMEQEEPYWCDFCYCDMDPESWFYCCQECPCYVTHTHCVEEETIIKARVFDNLPIQL